MCWLIIFGESNMLALHFLELTRRAVDMKEREFLRDKFVVTETQCDLG